MAGNNIGIRIQITQDITIKISILISIGETVFPPAEYTYRFEWNLPAELPVSFEGKHGYIRYNIVAGLDRLSQQEKCFVEPFIVWKRLDLNEMPDLKVLIA